MKRNLILLFVFSLSLFCSGQVTLVGHTQLNNIAINQVTISVKVNGKVTHSLNTQSKSEFKLVFEYGKIYNIYFQHPKCPVMFMQVIANTIPVEKYHYLMGYDLKIPFVYKYDEDVDTSVFKNPFFKIYFDGERSMASDTAYNNRFAHSVIKDHLKDSSDKLSEDHLLLAGKVLLNGDPLTPAANKIIQLVGPHQDVLKTSITTKSGMFAFTAVTASQVSKITLQDKDTLVSNSLSLQDTKGNQIAIARSAKGQCEWPLSQTEIKKLNDKHFTFNIGGKLVSSSIKEKKFYAEKEVYLLNKHNTILKKTSTNLFGTFVFENIRPDVSYCIAISKEGLMKGEKIDLLNKNDTYLTTLDSLVAGKLACRLLAGNNKNFSELCVSETELKMDIKATIFGDNINQPIGRLKIILLNDSYEVIDSAITDDFGTFKFKYLPFLKRFFLSAENTDNVLDVFKNILIYSEEDNLIKIMTHQKGAKFSYKPVSAELYSLREIELEDPWLELVGPKKTGSEDVPGISKGNKLIVENIMFEPGKYDITDQAKEILDKVVLVLNANKNLRIEVGAHTDSKGSAAANLKLSELRAKMVVDYIIRSAIGIDRISARGYGESQLLNHCKDEVPCSETEHAQNRRIEFKILGEQ